MPARVSWKKTVALLGVIVLVVLLARAWSGGSAQATRTPAHAAVVPVKVAVAQRGNLALTVTVNGYVEAYSTVTVQSRVSGQLQSLAFTPGGPVKAGDVIARIDPSLLQAQRDQARGNLAKDQAQLANARQVLRRYTPMLAKGYVSKTDYDTYVANEGVEAAAVKADQAAVEMAQTQLGYAQIRAPVDSVAGAPLVYPGAQVTANSTNLVVLNQVQPIHVRFAVPESALPGIRAAFARGPVHAALQVPGAHGTPLSAPLDFINNAVDAGTGTIQLKASYPNRDDRLTPGQFVQVTLPTATLADVVTVPATALQNSPQGSFVFVIDADGRARQRMVTAGVSNAGRIVIDQGLAGGERVVTDGQMLLTDGTRVQVVAE